MRVQAYSPDLPYKHSARLGGQAQGTSAASWCCLPGTGLPFQQRWCSCWPPCRRDCHKYATEDIVPLHGGRDVSQNLYLQATSLAWAQCSRVPRRSDQRVDRTDGVREAACTCGRGSWSARSKAHPIASAEMMPSPHSFLEVFPVATVERLFSRGRRTPSSSRGGLAPARQPVGGSVVHAEGIRPAIEGRGQLPLNRPERPAKCQ